MESLLRENRVFPPRGSSAAKSADPELLAEYEAMYRRSVEDPEEFLGGGGRRARWFAPWQKVLEGGMGSAKWFYWSPAS